jgi:hypothetical protein
MAETSDREPLWMTMNCAYRDAIDSDTFSMSVEKATGAEIRAMAKAMAAAEHRGEFTSSGLYVWLLAEADRTEREMPQVVT